MFRIVFILMTFLYVIGTCAVPLSMSHAEENQPPVATVDEKKAIQWADSLMDALESGEKATDLINWDVFMARCTRGSEISQKDLSDSQRALQKSMETPLGLFGLIRNETDLGDGYKYMRVITDPEGTRVRFRFLLSAGGIDFHDYLLTEERDQVLATDFKIASTGEDFSESQRRFVVLLVAQNNQQLLQKLTEEKVEMTRHLRDFFAMAKAISENNPEQVVLIANGLPMQVRNEKLCLLMESKAAQMVSDDNAQLDVIERFRRCYPNDASIDLHSIQYFVMKGKFAEALECAKRFQRSVGEEAYMMTMIADLQRQNGQIKEATDSINKAILMEPDYVDAYRTLLVIAQSQKDFVTVKMTLQRLVEDFDEELDPDEMREDLFYEEFVKSTEFADLETFLESRKK